MGNFDVMDRPALQGGTSHPWIDALRDGVADAAKLRLAVRRPWRLWDQARAALPSEIRPTTTGAAHAAGWDASFVIW
jgi:hypothetical protein